jgi:hypothetical protein
MDNYRTERLTWQGIVIEVRYDPDWLPSYRETYGYPSPILKSNRSVRQWSRCR